MGNTELPADVNPTSVLRNCPCRIPVPEPDTLYANVLKCQKLLEELLQRMAIDPDCSFTMYDRTTGGLVDCDDGYPTIVITDPSDETVVSSTEMTFLETGTYYYNFSITSTYSPGDYNALVTGVATVASGTRTEKERSLIRVI